MKKYENPMLQVVSVKNYDIVCTSPTAAMSASSQDNDVALGADRFRDWED